ncbi:unnamed protein product [Polarella glacialis]|uniref:CRAL-TRIO domain-containing protein n=1 Tax=Polarella glacialis TaxID=89957 RepID=A0A813H0T3_POLGL|nr:unnamed protein product [Polarella glacialis]
MASAAGARWSEKLPELRRALAEQEPLPQYRDVDGRDVPWQQSAAGTDTALLRFLVARKGDVPRAATMYSKSLSWRSSVFPIPAEGKVGAILRDGRRFRRIGTNANGIPVLLLDFLWSYFITEEDQAIDILRAILRFMEEQLFDADAAGVGQAYVVVFGGPPPMSFAVAMASILEANYPERLGKAVVYPVPRLISSIVWAFLWFLDENTRSKVSVETYEERLLSAIHIEAWDLPDFMRGGLAGVEERFSPDKARMNALLRRGLTQDKGEAAELQRQLLRNVEPEVELMEIQPSSTDDLSWPWSCCCVAREAASDRTDLVTRPHSRRETKMVEAKPDLEASVVRIGTGAAGSAGLPSIFLATAITVLLAALLYANQFVFVSAA